MLRFSFRSDGCNVDSNLVRIVRRGHVLMIRFERGSAWSPVCVPHLSNEQNGSLSSEVRTMFYYQQVSIPVWSLGRSSIGVENRSLSNDWFHRLGRKRIVRKISETRTDFDTSGVVYLCSSRLSRDYYCWLVGKRFRSNHEWCRWSRTFFVQIRQRPLCISYSFLV